MTRGSEMKKWHTSFSFRRIPSVCTVVLKSPGWSTTSPGKHVSKTRSGMMLAHLEPSRRLELPLLTQPKLHWYPYFSQMKRRNTYCFPVGINRESHFPVAIWAAHRLGAFVFTVNVLYTVDELVPHLADMESYLLVVHLSALEIVKKAEALVGISLNRIILSAALEERKVSPEILTLQDVVELGYSIKETCQFTEFKFRPGEGKTKATLYFPSSGTTGAPKMVAIPHSSFIANIIQTAAHDAGLDISALLSSGRGSLLSQRPAVKEADMSLVLYSWVVPVSVHLAKTLGEILPQVVVESYGMTELTGSMTMPPLNQRWQQTPLAITHPDSPLAFGHGRKWGALCHRPGPSLVTHYVNNEKRCARIGEVYFDKDHELHLDRIKVASAEPQDCLVANPDTKDCCVMSVAHEFSGEVPKAYTILVMTLWSKFGATQGKNIKNALK
ncbi:hypothetical protein DFH07DRAFT_935096 [Mycena maculata]|uniref:AMP-dependent synthetase/ligase domain-containing protein n=1 Tax=Mycena maculata TaxID=230809 RepID=A0AAD7KH07_9AGAR|nr:hypothetical protein DFH07DRAFT_935096 [Mycena maculata]